MESGFQVNKYDAIFHIDGNYSYHTIIAHNKEEVLQIAKDILCTDAIIQAIYEDDGINKYMHTVKNGKII